MISSVQLSGIGKEMKNLEGKRIEKIYQSNDGGLWFLFREEKTRRLFINCSPALSSSFITETKVSFPKKPTTFCLLLRKHLTGNRLSRVVKKPMDRMITLIFEPSGSKLYCRFYGNGGFLLADGEDKILGNFGFSFGSSIKCGELFVPKEPSKEGVEEEFLCKGSISKIMEEQYGELILKQNKKSISSVVKREIRKKKKLEKSLTAEREELQKWKGSKKRGDICATYFGKIKRGDVELRVPDIETGDEVVVPLEPELSPKENMELHYKRERKFSKGLLRIEEVSKQNSEVLSKLKSDLEKIESAENVEELEQFFSCYKVLEKPKPTSKNKTTKAGEKKSLFRHFVTATGFEVLVGRNSLENDALVRRSKGNDIWFHLRGFPGSHTVLKRGGKKDIPYQAIIEGAEIALRYSSKARDKRGNIIYTQVKNVKRPKGASPGKVTVTHEKTVSVTIS